MPYFPILKNSDDRRATQAANPVSLRNCFIESAPEHAPRRSSYFVRPVPGRQRRATLAANCRGLFCEPGSLASELHAVGGSVFQSIDSAWTVATIAALPSGSGVVRMEPLRDKMGMLADQLLYGYDDSTFAQLTAVDTPNPASTLASVALRFTAGYANGDLWSWSAAGDYTSWPASGIAADVDQPDPLIAQANCNGALCNLNSNSVQFWEPTTGAEDEAFVPMLGATFRAAGIRGPNLFAKTRGGLMFAGSDNVVYDIGGISVQPVPSPDIEQAFKSKDPDELAEGVAWSYVDGSHEFIGWNIGDEVCRVLDRSLGLWHERTRFGLEAYDVHFAATAYGKTVLAGLSSPYVWSLEDDLFTDDGETIERVATVFVPVEGDTTLDRIALDCEWRAQPVSGQGSAPSIMLSVSKDGGESWTPERVLSLPVLGQRGKRVQSFAFGKANAEYGVLVRLRITDPVGFAWWGLWINASPEELP